MADEPINYTKLMEMYAACGPQPNPLIRYEIDEHGVVNLYREDGSWGGCTTRKGLQYLLDNQPCTPPKS